MRTKANEWGAVFSPDGRWVVYYSEESGTGEIYVRPFRGRGGPWLVSSGAGIAERSTPLAAQGDALYYLSSDRHIMEVTHPRRQRVRRGPSTPLVGCPHAVCTLQPFT